MNPEEILEQMFKSYWDEVERYADTCFKVHILPWLQKYHIIFISGNGCYYTGATKETPRRIALMYWSAGTYVGDEETQLDHDKFPEKIRKYLDAYIPGSEQSLGSIMPNYIPEERED